MYNKTPAQWTQQGQFAVSEKGAIKGDGDFSGRPSFLNLETAEHILNNLESFKEAVALSKSRQLNVVANRQLNKMQVDFIKMGLTPEQAAQAVQAAINNKRTA